jgi:hypothetical protein
MSPKTAPHKEAPQDIILPPAVSPITVASASTDSASKPPGQEGPPPAPPPPPSSIGSGPANIHGILSPESDRGEGMYTGPATTMVDGYVIPIGARRGSSSSVSSVDSIRKRLNANNGPPDSNGGVEVKRFEELFCFVPGSDPRAAAPRMVQKAQFTTILDLRRANNVAIGMSRFTRRKLTADDLTLAIQQLDESVLNTDDLVAIQGMMPTRDERKLLQYYMDTVGSGRETLKAKAKIPSLPLAPAETFMFEMMKDPKLPGRLEAFQFKLELSLEKEDLKSQIDNMSKVCLALKTSESLKLILRTVLHLGNLSNQEYGAGNSSYRPWMGKEARALGFKIEGLARLKDVKSADGKWSLMHFLVDMVRQQSREDVLDFTFEDGLREMREVRNYDYLDVIARIMDLEKVWRIHNQEWGDQFAQNSVTDDENDEVEWDPDFRVRMKAVLDEGRQTVDGLKTAFEDFGQAWSEAAKYFGEDLEDYAAISYEEGAKVVEMGLTSSHQLLSGPGSGRRKGTTHIHSASGKIEALGNRKLPIHLFISLDLFFKAFEEGVKTNRKKIEEEQKKQKQGVGRYAEKRGYYNNNPAAAAAYNQYYNTNSTSAAAGTNYYNTPTVSITSAADQNTPTASATTPNHVASSAATSPATTIIGTSSPHTPAPAAGSTSNTPTLLKSQDDVDTEEEEDIHHEESEGVQGGMNDAKKREEAKAMFHRFSMMQIGSRVTVDDEDDYDEEGEPLDERSRVEEETTY